LDFTGFEGRRLHRDTAVVVVAAAAAAVAVAVAAAAAWCEAAALWPPAHAGTIDSLQEKRGTCDSGGDIGVKGEATHSHDWHVHAKESNATTTSARMNANTTTISGDSHWVAEQPLQVCHRVAVEAVMREMRHSRIERKPQPVVVRWQAVGDCKRSEVRRRHQAAPASDASKIVRHTSHGPTTTHTCWNIGCAFVQHSLHLKSWWRVLQTAG
jgi:hypothetical protein